LNSPVPEEPGPAPEESGGKRVSWVELYFDLIFAFAVGQTAHIMVADPHWGGLGRAVGLFVPLWWTWIGFVVLYNRHGEDHISQRLLLLVGTLPCAVAAVETHSAARGDLLAFTFALAGARLVLAAAFAFTAEGARPVSIGYGFSTAAFAASAFVPSPWRYLIWAFALLQEAGFLLLRGNGEPSGDRTRDRTRDRNGDRTRERGAERPPRPSRTEQVASLFKPPADPSRRVDAGHLAERFGGMIIILLGEVVASVGASAVDLPDHDLRYWAGLLAGLVLAAALWWIYFTAAAPMSESVLSASGGNPNLAYGLYAGGHLPPAFALLGMSAGVSLVLSGDSPQAAAWFVTGGLAVYLVGTRVVLTSRLTRFEPQLRWAVAGATACLAFLAPLISAAGVVLVTTAWAAAVAAYETWRAPGRLKDILADPLTFFRRA
jgi:low temperature requirement protein LtrA